MKIEVITVVLFIIFFIVLCLGIRFLNNKSSSKETKEAEVLSENESSSSATQKGLPTGEAGKTMQLPQMQIMASKTYKAVLATSQGDISIELNAAQTPKTVNNFVYLARNNFYDNTTFQDLLDAEKKTESQYVPCYSI